MATLQVMERAVVYTTDKYAEAYKNTCDPRILYEYANWYSAEALCKVINSPDGMCQDYTRTDNLRYDIASCKNDIKHELLKNIVNVGMYQRINDTRAGNELGSTIRQNMNSDQIAVAVMNAMINEGVHKGYEMLEDPNILASACYSFAHYRGNIMRRQEMDNIARTDAAALWLNNSLDNYKEYINTQSYDASGYGGK